ncbi:MAG TPA: VOC family protein [Gemmatimonadaceae bacterium]
MTTDRGFVRTIREQTSTAAPGRSVEARFHGVRYQVKDVRRSVEFYARHLGFQIDHQWAPVYATLRLGPLYLLLTGPSATGSRPVRDGRVQGPGGWNRVVLRVDNLPAWIDKLKKGGVQFRNAMETGPGGRQIQLEDPDGNSVELFEPAA